MDYRHHELTMRIQELNLAQIKRFVESGMKLEEFLAQPDETAAVFAMDRLAAERDRLRPTNLL